MDSMSEERSPVNLVAERSVVVGLEKVLEVAVMAAVFLRRFIRAPASSPLVEV